MLIHVEIIKTIAELTLNWGVDIIIKKWTKNDIIKSIIELVVKTNDRE